MEFCTVGRRILVEDQNAKLRTAKKHPDNGRTKYSEIAELRCHLSLLSGNVHHGTKYIGPTAHQIYRLVHHSVTCSSLEKKNEIHLGIFCTVLFESYIIC